VQAETADHGLRQVAPDAVGEDGDARADVDARLEGRLHLPMPAETAVTGTPPRDSIAVVQDFSSGESRKDVDAFGLDQPTQPLHETTERDDEVAVIVERRRRDREFELAPAGQEIDAVVADGGAERCAALFEVRDEIAQGA